MNIIIFITTKANKQWGSCVHIQGDGTAVCLQGNPAVFTVSMHAANNFPARKQKSSLDVPLPDGMEDDDYLRYCSDTSDYTLKLSSAHQSLTASSSVANVRHAHHRILISMETKDQEHALLQQMQDVSALGGANILAAVGTSQHASQQAGGEGTTALA